MATPKESAYKNIFALLEKHVKIRETGRIAQSGGTLKFLGRTITRKAGSPALFLHVDCTYMGECFREYSIEKGSSNFPDIRGAIEETVNREPILCSYIGISD